MSHRVEVSIEFRDPDALGDAVVALGGKVIGHGTHTLFDGAVQGFAFSLPGWKFPLCLQADGKLVFDDYSGKWGDQKDLERLKGEYALAVAAAKCEELGWMTERQGDDLVIYHPSGGSIVVTKSGSVDANSFQGTGCDAAVTAIAEALGTETSRSCKTEYGQVLNEAHVIT